MRLPPKNPWTTWVNSLKHEDSIKQATRGQNNNDNNKHSGTFGTCPLPVAHTLSQTQRFAIINIKEFEHHKVGTVK